MSIAIQTAGIVNQRVTPVSVNTIQIQEHYQYDVTANSTITLLATPINGTEVNIRTRNNITATLVVAGGGLINNKTSEIITGDNLVECRFFNGVWTTSAIDPASAVAFGVGTVYLDTLNGNDSTGTINRIDRPFLTLQSAVNVAASAFIVISYGSTITESSVTISKTLSIACSGNVTFSNTTTINVGTGFSLTITGTDDSTFRSIINGSSTGNLTIQRFGTIDVSTIPIATPALSGFRDVTIQEIGTINSGAFLCLFSRSCIMQDIKIIIRMGILRCSATVLVAGTRTTIQNVNSLSSISYTLSGRGCIEMDVGTISLVDISGGGEDFIFRPILIRNNVSALATLTVNIINSKLRTLSNYIVQEQTGTSLSLNLFIRNSRLASGLGSGIISPTITSITLDSIGLIRNNLLYSGLTTITNDINNILSASIP